MAIPPRLLLAVLVYLSLDVPLPSMPGAFEFDVGHSVESVQLSRLRATEATAGPLALAPHLPPVTDRVSALRRDLAPLRAVPQVPPRTAEASPPLREPEPASSSDDPH